MEEKRHLGKEQKIKNMLIQRNFIENQLNKSPRADGNPAYRYVGYLFPENKKYFDSIGVNVTSFYSEVTLKITGGMPIHIFTPICIEELTDEELKKSEEYADAIKEKEPNFAEFLSSLLSETVDELKEKDITKAEEYIKAKEQLNEEVAEFDKLMSLLCNE